MKHLYKVTQAVSNNMQRGIALKNKYNKRKSASYSNTVEQVKKAEIIFSESDLGLTLDSVKEIYNVLTKLEKSVDFRKRLEDKGPTEEIIKFYAYGGSSGLAWSRMILKEQNIVKSHRGVITEADINKDGDDKTYGKIQVAKAVNEELMQVTYVAMKPGVDLQLDEVNLEDIRLAKESFNKSMMRANMFHMVMTDTFDIIESYLAPTTMILNKSVVEEGEWLVTLQIYDNALWNMIKNDEITGVSIGALASVQNLED
jgi:hypothetical protein